MHWMCITMCSILSGAACANFPMQRSRLQAARPDREPTAIVPWRGAAPKPFAIILYQCGIFLPIGYNWLHVAFRHSLPTAHTPTDVRKIAAWKFRLIAESYCVLLSCAIQCVYHILR